MRGVGGTAKRNADTQAVIQDAHDFLAWTSSSQSEIQYQLITAEEYSASNTEV